MTSKYEENMKTDHTWETVAINTGVKHVIVLLMWDSYCFCAQQITTSKLNQVKVFKASQVQRKHCGKDSGKHKKNLPLSFKANRDICGASRQLERVVECLLQSL